MLGPADRAIAAREALDCLDDMHRAIVQREAPFDLQAGERKARAHGEPIPAGVDVVARNRCLAVRTEPGRELLIGRRSEDVEAPVVAHDPGQELRVGAGAVLRVASRIEGGRLDRRPCRRPQRVDPRSLDHDLGDMASFCEHGDLQIAVLDRHRAAAAMQGEGRHRCRQYAERGQPRGTNGGARDVSHRATAGCRAPVARGRHRRARRLSMRNGGDCGRQP